MDLLDAATYGNLERVRLLVEQGADPNMSVENDFTALFCASFEGHLEVVQYLVEQRAIIDMTTNGGSKYTPLTAAACSGHTDVVRYLLEQGADRDKADLEGNTP